MCTVSESEVEMVERHKWKLTVLTLKSQFWL
jgi:hypothetical protein